MNYWRECITEALEDSGIAENNASSFGSQTYTLNRGKKMKDSITLEQVKEAAALLKALAPPSPPDNTLFVNSITGLKLIRDKSLPAGTIIISEELFTMIFNSSEDLKLVSDQSKVKK